MSRNTKILGFIVATLMLASIFTLIFTFVLNKLSNRIVSQWKQLSSIKYNSFDPYYLTVIEGNVDWSEFPFKERNYVIYVGRDEGVSGYGHWLKFPFYDKQPDAQIEIVHSEVEWSEDGVTFKSTSGHTLFIPKRQFIGGR